jgi:hypothetical protein
VHFNAAYDALLSMPMVSPIRRGHRELQGHLSLDPPNQAPIQTPPLPSFSEDILRYFHPAPSSLQVRDPASIGRLVCAFLEAVWPAGGDETRCSDVVIWATKHGGFWMSIIRHVISCLISPKNAGVGFPGDLDINWYFKLGVWR